MQERYEPSEQEKNIIKKILETADLPQIILAIKVKKVPIRALLQAFLMQKTDEEIHQLVNASIIRTILLEERLLGAYLRR